MICPTCGHEWTLLQAHVIRTTRTPGGARELVQCPGCGHTQTVIRPDMEAAVNGGD